MGKANLDHNFKEFLECLNSEGVRYLVLGGYAVNFYGYHRSTGDLDVWIAVEPVNAAKLSLVLQRFGDFPRSDVKPGMFLQRGKVFQLGRVPVRIDILTDPSGVEFEDCYQRRRIAELDGIAVPFISLEDLKVNKTASGRPKDVADIAALSAITGRSKPPVNRPRRRGRKKS